MIAALLSLLRNKPMDRYRSRLTENGTQTDVIDTVTGETLCTCAGPRHAENANRILIDVNRGERVSNPMHRKDAK